jgi:hypothetical protein
MTRMTNAKIVKIANGHINRVKSCSIFQIYNTVTTVVDSPISTKGTEEYLHAKYATFIIIISCNVPKSLVCLYCGIDIYLRDRCLVVDRFDSR